MMNEGFFVALDDGQELPFELKRVFYIYDVPLGANRAKHSITASMLLVCVSGSVSVACDNGLEKTTYHLCCPDIAVHTKPGILVDLTDFSKSAVLLVLASQSFDETRYFERPMFNELAAIDNDRRDQ